MTEGTAPAFDSEMQVRVLLHRTLTRSETDHLADLAVAVDRFASESDDPCPRG